MNKPVTVFKFCSAEGGAAILRNKCIFVTSPLDLNDAFEMRPAWTNEHQERHRQNEMKRISLLRGTQAFAATERGLVPIGKLAPEAEPEKIDVDNQRGIADQHNQHVFQLLHDRYRILSFCADILNINKQYDEGDENHTLMWSHYGNMFQGVCLAIDPAKIENGIRENGFPVRYEKTRRSFPTSFYDTFLSRDKDCVKMHGIEFSTDAESKLLLMDHSHEQKFEQHLLAFLQHKSPAWAYEHEVRMIYRLPALRASECYRKPEFACATCKTAKMTWDKCNHTTYRDAIHLPPEAIRAVIFGTDASLAAIHEIFTLLDDACYAHVSLFWSSLHSERYVIQYNKSDKHYVECIHRMRTEHVAYAKGHVHPSQSGTKVLPAGKGVSYTMKKPDTNQ
jgi:hypothetical protein